jgi:hypothetical protein
MSSPPLDLRPWSVAFEAPPFLPGRTARPAPLDWPERAPGGAAAPDLAADEAWRRSPAYLVGWRCYRSGRFWEAHEAWESAWQAARRAGLESQAARLRCLIQVAAAALKLRLGQTATARVLLARAERNALAAGADPQLGIELESWLASWRRLLAGPAPDWRARPAAPGALGP